MAKIKGSNLQNKAPLSKETVSDSDDLESIDSAESSAEDIKSDETSDVETESESKAVKDPESEELNEQEDELEAGESEEQHQSHVVVRPTSSRDQFTSTGVRPVAPFVPPPGFTRIRDLSAHVSISQNFSEISLKGKELWHFSAPAGISLEDLHNASLHDIQRGGPVFERQGAQYGLVTLNDSNIEGMKIMVPSKAGYKTVHAKINKTLRVQRVAAMPKSILPPSLAPRPRPTQPQGLRMRYKPSGFGVGDPGTLGDSDSDELPVPSFQIPPPIPDIPVDESPKKRKREEGSIEMSDKKSKSDKKKEKKKHQDTEKEQKHKHMDKDKKKEKKKNKERSKE